MQLSIVPVVAENRSAAEALHVLPEQIDFIESVPECLAEADELADWRPVMLLEGETPVGFAMYGFITIDTPPRLWFDRLLIDGRYQGRGLGDAAFGAVLGRIQGEFPGLDIYLSVYEENQLAMGMYEKFGFRRNGELDAKGEKIMVLRGAAL